jgi:general stress protein YciG
MPLKRGFSSPNFPKHKHKEIASKGGKAAWAKGTAHKFTHKEAVAAGHKGGSRTAAKFRFNEEIPDGHSAKCNTNDE